MADVRQEFAFEAIGFVERKVRLGDLAELQIQSFIDGAKLVVALLEIGQHRVEGFRKLLELIAGVDVVVLLGRRWGDTAAIVLASLSMIANFVVIPFYPIWSLVIIALNAALVWALTTLGRNVA